MFKCPKCWKFTTPIDGACPYCGYGKPPSRPAVSPIAPAIACRHCASIPCDPVTLAATNARRLLEAVRAAGDWSRGAPPAPGWWLASAERAPNMWRWWNGYYWSVSAPDTCTAEDAAQAARYRAMFQHLIEWSSYWPENARVVRY